MAKIVFNSKIGNHCSKPNSQWPEPNYFCWVLPLVYKKMLTAPINCYFIIILICIDILSGLEVYLGMFYFQLCHMGASSKASPLYKHFYPLIRDPPPPQIGNHWYREWSLMFYQSTKLKSHNMSLLCLLCNISLLFFIIDVRASYELWILGLSQCAEDPLCSFVFCLYSLQNTFKFMS